MSAATLNVNVTCLACDGVRPCAECRALGRTFASAGYRVFHSSRYAALRAAADGTYGFAACVIPVKAGEQRIVDAVVALLPDASVAIAAEDATLISPLPRRFVAFPRVDYLAGKPPAGWMRSLKEPDLEGEPERHQQREAAPPAHATSRLRSTTTARASRDGDAMLLLGDELAWHRASGLGFAVLVVSGAGAAPARLKAALSASLRANDSLALQQDDCIAVLAGVNATQARRVVSRAVAAASRRLRIARVGLRWGLAVCPDDGDEPEALLAAARSKM